MAEGPNPPSSGQAPASPASPVTHRLRNWTIGIVTAIIVLPILGFTVWAGITLNYSYSTGERAGFVQKFSQKGWICKTWEGELSMVNLPGAAQERWQFTVRDDSIAALILKDMGARVALEYHQHRGVPSSCFGETEYFVTAVHPAATAP